ncbi:hypothetical protein J7E50_23505 [Pedobacter sp. ISL-68]|uniref:hypothetical protein n=1 Tax=unclassified Pedobacter TaxID=2628915 RepID=UPI001BE9B4B5|nr:MULTISPECIES: hypothetical protein [unclassified Pedobacter]MBT2564387.1 hypothetical protein [Pedobacter sp. ISL-64]MBT2593207.1 hypothetical protein [Pedobacter sp. ISL-68]
MRLNIKNVMLMVMVLTITACEFSFNTPEEYFDRAALNTNGVSRFGTYYFEGYQIYLKSVTGPGKVTNCEKYLQNAIASAEKDLEKVKKLKPTAKTEAMLNASKDLYTYVLASYKTEHLQVAKMIDNHEPEDKINAVLVKVDTKSYDIFIKKYEKLWKLADVYAKENGIEVEKMPF